MGNAEIYYFSGTGNSLMLAKDLAGKLDARLTSIPSVMAQAAIAPEADTIGIVFPVYYIQDICVPLIVERFIGKLEGIGSKYIFAVCNFGGGSVHAIRYVRGMIRERGGTLAAGFGIRMPQNAFYKPNENKQKLFAQASKKTEKIYRYVAARKHGKYDDLWNVFIKLILAPVLPKLRRDGVRDLSRIAESGPRPFRELVPLTDNSFSADGNCNGCGICAKVCPVNNISIDGKKPVWHNRCENCIACASWCPRDAIRGGVLQEGMRYRHPGVNVSEMFTRSR
ncbi:MAG: hypothetical protein A2Y33_06705 [Spirochaetes bacterium GWF1_51_8]|nr:MAG: hypothetical protein A2Y33_06705 [Spirochaetes bacterium GWF1_51_8]